MKLQVLSKAPMTDKAPDPYVNARALMPRRPWSRAGCVPTVESLAGITTCEFVALGRPRGSS